MTKFSKTNYLFGTNGIYEVIHCNSSITIFGRNFPKLYLENKEENLFFTLTFNDLFQEIEEKYIFLVIFPEKSYHSIYSSWYLGIPFYKAHQLVFNYDSDSKPGFPVMIEHKKEMNRVGIYILNVENLILDNVKFNGNIGNDILEEE